MRRLKRSFFRRSSLAVAPELLNKLLVLGERCGRIVEVEAYTGSEEPGSHAYRGPTRRNSTMFGPPGHLYVYFIYGIHWCANVVCEDRGVASAVLIRALDPLSGVEEMRRARTTARRDRDLCSGPAKLCQAFGITGADDGCDLIAGGEISISSDGTPPPAQLASPDRRRRLKLEPGAWSRRPAEVRERPEEPPGSKAAGCLLRTVSDTRSRD